jgi:phenylacetate-CoA ligase
MAKNKFAFNILKYLPRFRRAYAEMGELVARQQWTRTTIHAFQLQRLNLLWLHAIEHVPYYRTLLRTLDLPRQFSSLDHFSAVIPVLSKSRVQADRNLFLSDRRQSGKWYLTGGSTGTPTHIFRSHEAHQEMLRARYCFHVSWGVDIFDRWAYLWGHSASFAPGFQGLLDRTLQPVNDWLRNRRRFSAYRLGRSDLQKHLRKIAAFDPVVIYTYSTAGYLLAIEKNQCNLSFPSLKMLNLTAEPAFQNIIRTVEHAFSVPAVVEYGSVECGFLAGEAPDRTLRAREDNVILETIHREDGRYDILVTVLGNLSFPLLRYAIGDVTDQPLQIPDAGFAMLHKVCGRDNDLIFARSGEPLHSVWFDDVIEYCPAVRRYRVHQHADGKLTVVIERASPDALVNVNRLRARLTMQVGYPVEIDVVDRMVGTPAGKHRWIYSDMTNKILSNN